ncbi:reverse transcriptase domain-containing protein [Mesorhizobium sp. YC-39]|uniref:reverse transcriptase domain-containing protein n=1 Tax=unclassified Mesorhizobium TaxID=325217 RepID=UPI0021E7CDB5|nr:MULTISPECIES: reverse transcriptase domain-containing protein [unclassified Mesorhizobium]MCV3206672.1 reverse transcriptase domain-containing protein [Mesorhizobium sp. YC-2]MCV3226928.1 reverse transcriptase domain-containing protein [Mesorhizobium sp. YC-39]
MPIIQNDKLATFRKIAGRRALCSFLKTSYAKNYSYYFYRLQESLRYKEFSISKRNGEARVISRPINGIRFIQTQLSNHLYSFYDPGTAVHGFAKGRSIVTNAKAHLRRKWILNIDIEGFFDSINFGRVRGLFLAKPFELPADTATALATIICHCNKLPQGAPTSPIVSNLIASTLDRELIKLCKGLGLQYTRYADDITISSRRASIPTQVATLEGDVWKLSNPLRAIFEAAGFKVNDKKTRLSKASSRQTVTGLTVNKFANVDRSYIRDLYASFHALKKFGLERYTETYNKKFLSKNKSKPSAVIDKLIGQIQYVGHVRGYDDPVYTKLAYNFNKLALKKIKVFDKIDHYMNSVFIVEDDDNITQGTCFLIDDAHVVTCYHCVPSENITIFSPNQPSVRYEAKKVRFNEEMDIAVLEIKHPNKSWKPLKIYDGDPPAIGTDVTLLGYPAWAPGKTIAIKNAQIQGLQTKSTLQHYILDKSIVSGNSGGPLIDANGLAIGIATHGAENSDKADTVYEHKVMSIDILKKI